MRNGHQGQAVDGPLNAPPSGGSVAGPAPKVRFLGDLQRLEVKPGDRFVLMLEEKITRDAVENIQRYWREFVGVDAKLIVLDGGMKIGVVGPVE